MTPLQVLREKGKERWNWQESERGPFAMPSTFERRSDFSDFLKFYPDVDSSKVHWQAPNGYQSVFMGNNSVNNLHINNYRQIEEGLPLVQGTRISNMHMEVMKTITRFVFVCKSPNIICRFMLLLESVLWWSQLLFPWIVCESLPVWQSYRTAWVEYSRTQSPGKLVFIHTVIWTHSQKTHSQAMPDPA